MQQEQLHEASPVRPGIPGIAEEVVPINEEIGISQFSQQLLSDMEKSLQHRIFCQWCGRSLLFYVMLVIFLFGSSLLTIKNLVLLCSLL